MRALRREIKKHHNTDLKIETSQNTFQEVLMLMVLSLEITLSYSAILWVSLCRQKLNNDVPCPPPKMMKVS